MLFRNEFEFLSNFFKSPVVFEGMTFPTVENAFQAAKTLDMSERRKFTSCAPGMAKRFGRRVALRDDWEYIKLDIMDRLLEEKFPSDASHPNYKLSEKLAALGTELDIVEDNTWHDNIWGNCTCPKCAGKPGKNLLGKALMKRQFRLLHPDSRL